MFYYVIVTLLTAVLFCAMILLLASKPKFAGKMTGAFIVIAAVGGLLIYGYGYAETAHSFPLAVIRALLAVCGMFVGNNDLSVISSTPLMQNTWMLLIFWVIHLFALYATASAAITTVGAEALKKLRLWLARRGQMNLIYGVNENSLAFGRELLVQKRGVVVYVDSKVDASQMAAIGSIGAVIRTDDSALSANRKFMRNIGISGVRRTVTLYALNKDAPSNIQYARAVLKSLQEQGVSVQQTNLVILGSEEAAVMQLQGSAGRYGYGSVAAIHEAEMVARLLTRTYPPCNCMEFDDQCKAKGDFEALIIGFGHVGQAVLKSLVMNGQFEGSTFRAAVFAPDCQSVNGSFSSRFQQILDNYEISFHPYDARSREMYDYLHCCGKKLKYIAVCAGSDKINHEIAEDLVAYLQGRGWNLPVYVCSYRGVKAYDSQGGGVTLNKLYRPELLSLTEMDHMAMVLNHRYQIPSDSTPLQNWLDCDYFSRMSCRAFTDFVPAVLRIAGRTKEQAIDGQWQFSDVQLENLSRTEHLRWCAFHYCMGFSTMSDDELDRRGQEYRRQMENSGAATIRIGKNMENRTHACLVSWEELEELAEKEAGYTGKRKDYQYLDSQNVLAIPELLRTGEVIK